MVSMQFNATDDADWAVSVALINQNTNAPLDTADAVIELEVSSCGSTVLSATTDDNTIEIPVTGTIQWHFTKEQMASTCPGTTYNVGCRLTNANGTVQLFVGTLAVVNGGFA